MTHNPEEPSQQRPEEDSPFIYEPEDVNRAASPFPGEAAQLPPEAETTPHDALAALRYRDYRLYAFGSLVAALGAQMFGVTVAWQLFSRTNDAWTLGLVGLLQAIPVIALALPAGAIADKYDRRRIVIITEFAIMLCWLAFVFMTIAHSPLWLFFLVLFIEATFGAFHNPARTAVLAQLVPEEVLANAITWNSSRWQMAATVGPALGGFAIAAFGIRNVYAIAAACGLVSLLSMIPLRPHPLVRQPESEDPWQRLIVGVRFVRSQGLFLATITLDLFAVFLGGAVTLLPVFAKQILHVGPAGLGWLRAAPAIGALAMSLWLSVRPPMKQAGRSLMWSVAGFGAATVVFGLSRNFWLSMVMLAITGALDNVSVVVRSTLLQVLTPPHMRGRVSAVNSVFIGSSNELGGFESGLAARYLGATMAVVSGGIGTILVVLGVRKAWPEVGQLGSLGDLRPVEMPDSVNS